MYKGLDENRKRSGHQLKAIKLEPGHAPEIIKIADGIDGVREALGGEPYGVAIDGAGLYVAYQNKHALAWATEGYYAPVTATVLSDTVIVTRMELASVHADDLGRVAVLLQPVDAFSEVGSNED